MDIKKERTRTQNTILNLFSGIIGEVIVYLFNFITRTVFIQTLGKEYLGIGGLFTNILSLLCLTDLGIGFALNYRLYKPLKEHDEKRLAVLMKFYKKVYRIIGWAILLLGVSLIPFLKYIINDYDQFAELGLSAAIVFLLYLMQSVSTYWFFAYKSAIVKANQKEYYLNAVGYISTFVTNIVQIVILLTTHNYMIYISVVILLNFAQNYVFSKIADHMFPFLRETCAENLSKEDTKQIFKDCGAISLFSINTVVLKATDNIVLAAFIGLNIVGMYSNYLMVYNAVKKIIKKLLRAVQASLGNLFASSSPKQKYDFFGTMNLVMTLICGTASVCIAVLTDEFIITWIGSDFVIAMPFSLLIALELYTIGIRLSLEQMRDVLGLFQMVKWRPVLAMILNIVISIAMVNYCGIYGVLIGTLISEWATVITIDPYMLHKHGFEGCCSVSKYYLRNGIYILELTVIGVANWIFKSNVFVGHGWLSVFFHAFVCGLSTLGFIMLLNRKSSEYKVIKEHVQGILIPILRKLKK